LPPPTADVLTTKTTFPEFNACYEAGTDCSSIAGTYGASAVKYEAPAPADPTPGTLPAWMTWNDGTQTFTIAPPTGSPELAGKTYKVYGTFTTTTASYGTPTELHLLTVTIDCVVTSFTMPAAPTGAALQYTLWATPLSFDFT